MKSVTRYKSTKELADLLSVSGFKVLKVSEPNDVEDGDITLEGNIHVQMPMQFALPNVVLEVSGPAFIFGPPCDNFGDLFAYIMSANKAGDSWNGTLA